MLISAGCFAFILEFGLIFMMTQAFRIPRQSGGLKNRELEKSIDLTNIPELSGTAGDANSQSRMNTRRFKRDEGEETSAASETSPPTDTENASKGQAETTPPISNPKIESSIKEETAANSGADKPKVPGEDETALVKNVTSVDAGQSDVIKDIQNIVLDSVQLLIHIKDNVGSGIKHVTTSTIDKVGGIIEGGKRTLQSVGQSFTGPILSLTQNLAEQIGFGEIIPGIVKLTSKPTSDTDKKD